MKELIEIQNELKAPKNQRNTFGNYNYRSAEDILEAVKPLLKKHGCYLTISDEMIQLGDRYYVKATATLSKDADSISTTAYAREEESKKGMDASQITGATSSYARKYALNGLFCIDDTKDADFTNTHGKEEQPKQKTVKVPAKAEIESDMKQAKEAILKCKSSKDLMVVWDTFKNLQGVAEFKNEMTNAKKRLGTK
jgi:hypothetical protein